MSRTWGRFQCRDSCRPYPRTIRSWLIWIKYLSWLYYTNEMAAVNQWENVSSLECDNSRNMTCFRNGTDVLNYYGFARVCKNALYVVSAVNPRECTGFLEPLQSWFGLAFCSVRHFSSRKFGSSDPTSQNPAKNALTQSSCLSRNVCFHSIYALFNCEIALIRKIHSSITVRPKRP